MLALAAPAPGAEKESWDVYVSAEEARLTYGIPESDAMTLAFACEAKAKNIEIVTTVLPQKPKKGQALKTTLSNGTATAAYEGKIAYTSAEEGYYFAATAPREPTTVDVLKSGTALTIAIPGKQKRVPLRGVATPLARFETACLRNRP